METLTVEGLDDYQAAMLEQDRTGFKALEALLTSAPLPGGRTDEFDDDPTEQSEEKAFQEISVERNISFNSCAR